MSEKRIIKKYPNRRLYDTAISSYITLENVRQLITEDVDVQVLDARTKNDITHNTLLQIIAECEETRPPLFSIEVLQAFIRLYGASMQGVMSKLLEDSTLYCLEQQKMLHTSLGRKENVNPMTCLNALTENNLLGWHALQEQWWRAFSQTVIAAPAQPLKATIETMSSSAG